MLSGRSKPVGIHVYYVYILTNPRHTVLYTGVTNNLHRRIYEHSREKGFGFTKRYNITQLVYFEHYNQILEAIKREKQIKAGSRKKKESLVEEKNPDWNDLVSSLK